MYGKAKNRHQLATDTQVFVVLFVLLVTNDLIVEVSGDHTDNDIDCGRIPHKLLQSSRQASADNSDMLASASTIPGLDGIRDFFSRNHQWITPLLAATPAKLATLMTIRALRQQQAEQMRLRPQNFDNVVALEPPEEERGAPQVDDNCDDDNCNDIDDNVPSNRKNSFMMFLGKGNIQVENNKNGDDESDYDDRKSVTYQKIDLEHKLMNKQMSSNQRADRQRALFRRRSNANKKSIGTHTRSKKNKKFTH